jgi:phosphoenolpyruvate-protein kinase (PTS system EI component)
LEDACRLAKAQINRLQERTLATIGGEEAAIFEAHAMFLEDPEFTAAIRASIVAEGINAEAAVEEVVEAFAQQMLSLEDAYFQPGRRISAMSGTAWFVAWRAYRPIARLPSNRRSSWRRPYSL